MTRMDDLGARLTADLVRAEQNAPAPTDLVERLLTGARRQHRQSPRRAPRWVWPALAAATVLIIVLATLWAANGNPFADRKARPAQPVPTDFRAWTVQFTDSRHGWAIGGASCGQRPCAMLGATSDGGLTWHSLSTPAGLTYDPTAAFCASPHCVTGVTFAPDGRHGYLYGLESASLYATSDGGRTWTAQRSPSAKSGLVVVAGSNAVRTSPDGSTLLVAPLGSDRWRDVTPWPHGVLGSSVVAHGSTAYALATGSEYAWLYRSTDAGQSWQRVPSTYLQRTPATFDLRGPLASWTFSVAPDGSIGVARNPNGQSATWRISTDGGRTFGPTRQFAVPPGGSGKTAGVRIAMASRSTVIEMLVNDAGTTYSVSTDAGASWRPIGAGSDRVSNDWGFAAADFGYRLADDRRGVQVTTNGGRTSTSRPFRS